MTALGSTSVAQPSIFSIIAAFFALKILLIFSYSSTDFEVHRNWLSITHSLPYSQWYTEATSIWTLDYPPFFAWFEWTLAKFAYFVDPGMQKISAEPYFNQKTLIFHRFTVILTDLFYVFASIRCAKSVQKRCQLPPRKTEAIFPVLVTLLVCNVGLLLVDNIHFQYNGFLSAFLLFSIVNLSEGNFLYGAFWYGCLVNFKHIYLYLAPAYVAYYLKFYCIEKGRLCFGKSLKLAAVLGSIALASFGPFLGQFWQVLERLFPVKRGLTHAYWAPNFWALYNFADLGLCVMGKRTGLLASDVTPAYTSGLVQEYGHTVLPNVAPVATLVLTAGSMIPFCLVVGHGHFLELLTLCAFNSYLFGWHVHEKAILLITVPLTILSAKNRKYCPIFLLLTTIGHCSLFPLFFTQFETPIKYLTTVIYSMTASQLLANIYGVNWQKFPFLSKLEILYISGFVPLEICKGILHEFLEKFPFVPLLLTSVYCAIGLVYCWVKFCYQYFCTELGVDVWVCRKMWGKEQEKLKMKLVLENEQDFLDENKLKLVGGIDISTSIYDSAAAFVSLAVFSYPDLELLHTVSEPVTISSPYMAGFLAFREVDSMVKLVQKLRKEHPDLVPQVLLVDGNGILHPRGFGLASHLGVLLDIPTVGVAKNLHNVFGLVRDVQKYEVELVSAGQTIPLHNMQNEEIGCALKPTEQVKNPIFVSIGHKIDLATATTIVIGCCRHRVPEPIRHADQNSRELVRKWYEA